MTTLDTDNPIRRCATEWIRANEPVALALVKEFPDLTVDELKAKTGWSDVQVNKMLSYLQIVGD